MLTSVAHPFLGDNMYAEDRQKPFIPLRPGDDLTLKPKTNIEKELS
jgi:hypothetical protein